MELGAHLAPKPDDIQVAVLGRGVGECVVVHVGGGSFIIVDSFNMPRTRTPAALHYLQAIGRGPEEVLAVVLTHLDRDHVVGAAACLSAAPASARLVVSDALDTREMLAFLKAADRPGKGGSAGVNELRAALAARSAQGEPYPRIRAKRGLHVLQQLTDRTPRVVLEATAPSEETIEEFQGGLAALLGTDPPALLPKPLRNLASVALHVQVGDVAVLLCGDLQHDTRAGHDDRGWAGARLPRGGTKASLVKLGHHGSHNGDHERIWAELADRDALAVATPFNSLQRPLPQPDDLRRVAGRGQNVYVAGSRRAHAPAGRPVPTAPPAPTAALALLRQAGVRARATPGRFGAVIFDRPADASAPWTVRRVGATDFRGRAPLI